VERDDTVKSFYELFTPTINVPVPAKGSQTLRIKEKVKIK
jgi:hypothetical protein